MNKPIHFHLLALALMFASHVTWAVQTEFKNESPRSNVDKLTAEIVRSPFVSVSRGLKEELEPAQFERAMAAFQDLRANGDGQNITTEEVLKKMAGDKQAFDLRSFLKSLMRACKPAFVELNGEIARMKSEENAWRKSFNGGSGCSVSLDKILKDRTLPQQTAGVVAPPAAGGTGSAN